jgi:glycosyltransferase involved in cell wall biosynthesis
MKISIITPSFNSEKTIDETLSSIASQNFKNFELIIVDNLSIDSTLEIIKSYKDKIDIKIISERDKGIADAFNKGIKNATGDIICILNSDDHYIDQYLFSDIISIMSGTSIDIVHGDIYFKDEILGSNIRKPLLCSITRAFPFNHPTFFVKKSVYERFGLFNPNFRYAMDFEWVCRLLLPKKTNEYQVSFHYFDKYPMVTMNAGGASYRFEMNTLNEVKKGLILHKKYYLTAWFFYHLRRNRLYLKNFLIHFGFLSLIRWWRNHKWQNLMNK